jgi:lipopolysaccharide/colanic/teichoic acid biosynthesis glycosyltransferase
MTQTPVYDCFKRLLDLGLSLIGLILLSPVILIVSITIRLTSKGPVFYRGLRTGMHGSTFYIYKFRSMVINSGWVDGSTAKNDSRITNIGHILRKYKLDELPQLINVLRGEMSLVGPRPELPRYTSLYTQAEQAILDVKPGITDFSSLKFIQQEEVLGFTDPDRAFVEKVLSEKNRLRLKYVKERNMWVDVKLIFKTITRIFN